MEQYALLMQNQWFILALAIWVTPWKGIALWRAAQRKEIWWFVPLLVINMFGLLEIVYIFFFSKKPIKKADK